MAAVMVREVFDVRAHEKPAPPRRPAAVPPRPARSARSARPDVDGPVVIDLRERRSGSVFDVEPEAVLRVVPAAPLAPRVRPYRVAPAAPRIERSRPPHHSPVRARSPRRAWLVVAAVALAIVGVAVTDDPAGGRLGGHGDAVSQTMSMAPAQPPAPTLSVVVQPGDTLWSIAAALVGDDDPRPLVDALEAAHGGAELHPGDVITIPAP
jgi:nucleoid-associated protein YgaU